MEQHAGVFQEGVEPAPVGHDGLRLGEGVGHEHEEHEEEDRDYHEYGGGQRQKLAVRCPAPDGGHDAEDRKHPGPEEE